MHVVRITHVDGIPHYACSCFNGMKKKPCKHGILAMARDKVIEFPPGAQDSTLRGLKRKGRPKISDIGRPKMLSLFSHK